VTRTTRARAREGPAALRWNLSISTKGKKMAKDDRYYELIVRRDSAARLCADALLRGDTAYAFTKAIEFKEADLELQPHYDHVPQE
jgi:hypothetical protein